MSRVCKSPLMLRGGFRGGGDRVSHASFRLHEAVLNHLRFVDALRRISRFRHRLLQVAAIGDRLREHIAALMHRRAVCLHGRVHIGDRLQHFIIDIDQSNAFAGDLVRLGHDQRQHIADITRRLADRDHQRPILLDQADMPVAGHILSRENTQHARMRQRRAQVHRLDERARVIAELQRADLHAVYADVIDITMLPQHQILRLILGQARADAAI